MSDNQVTLGRLLDRPDIDMKCRALDLGHHTAVLAQSGAGKSFFLGRLVEEILLRTKARVFVIDPNGDFRNVHEVGKKAWDDKIIQKCWGSSPPEDPLEKTQDGFGGPWGQVTFRHLRAGNVQGGSNKVGVVPCVLQWKDGNNLGPLRHWLPLLIPNEQKLDAALDIANWTGGSSYWEDNQVLQEAWAAFMTAVKEGNPNPGPDQTTQWLHLKRLSLVYWDIWAKEANQNSLLTGVSTTDGIRVTVLDIQSLAIQSARNTVAPAGPSPGEEARLATYASLSSLWDSAVESWQCVQNDEPDKRVPTFIVIDEAHNFAPALPRGPLCEAVSDEVTRIAAEGRKYGLFLILATQRPAKLAPGLLAECENVCLLRLQSPLDLQAAYDTWRIPHEVLDRVPWFLKGEGVLAGRWVTGPTFFHSAPRRSKEGGGDLPSGWAEPPQFTTQTSGSNGS